MKGDQPNEPDRLLDAVVQTKLGRKAFEYVRRYRASDNWIKQIFFMHCYIILAVPAMFLAIVLIAEKEVMSIFEFLLSKWMKAPHRTISEPPGSKLLLFVDFLFSPRTVEQTFKPLVADWQYEYFEALKQGRTSKASWVSMRYRCLFVWCIGLSKLFSLLKQLKSTSK